MVIDDEFNPSRPTTNEGTVRGLREVMHEAFAMKTVNEKGKVDSALRRAICYLVREASMRLHTFAVLQFVHQVTRPELRDDLQLGEREMSRLSEAPRDVPAVYYALASDVFAYCARRRAKALAREEKHGEEIIQPPDLREEGQSVIRAAGMA